VARDNLVQARVNNSDAITAAEANINMQMSKAELLIFPVQFKITLSLHAL
jgi:hypothetical protein